MYFTALIVIQFFRQKGYYIYTEKHKGVLKMSPRQKVLAIRLSEKISKNPAFAKSIGIEIKSKNIILKKKKNKLGGQNID